MLFSIFIIVQHLKNMGDLELVELSTFRLDSSLKGFLINLFLWV
jgi:hypothetical protein